MKKPDEEPEQNEEAAPSRIKWEGNSRDVIAGWPKPVKSNIGGDLQRLEDREKPLDSKHLGDGIHELRDEDKRAWYRLLYWLNQGWIYVLHCFEKKTNQTPLSDLRLATERKKRVIQRDDPPYVEPEAPAEEEESA